MHKLHQSVRLWNTRGVIYEPEGNTSHLHPEEDETNPISSPSFLLFSLAFLPPDFHSTTDPSDKTRAEIGTFGQKLEGSSILSGFDTM